jgi:stalled ribosome alternative rescue factor ArfA
MTVTNPIGQFLTGDANVDILIMLQLDDPTLATTCQTNKYAKQLCNNENFWRQKVEQLPNAKGKTNVRKPIEKTWRDYYRQLTEITIPVQVVPMGGAPNVYPQIFTIHLPKNLVRQINSLYTVAERGYIRDNALTSGYLEERIPELGALIVEQFREHPEYFTNVELDTPEPGRVIIRPTLLYVQAANWLGVRLNNYEPGVIISYNFNAQHQLTSIRINR